MTSLMSSRPETLLSLKPAGVAVGVADEVVEVGEVDAADTVVVPRAPKREYPSGLKSPLLTFFLTTQS